MRFHTSLLALASALASALSLGRVSPVKGTAYDLTNVKWADLTYEGPAFKGEFLRLLDRYTIVSSSLKMVADEGRPRRSKRDDHRLR
jgi:hypothetical protein